VTDVEEMNEESDLDEDAGIEGKEATEEDTETEKEGEKEVGGEKEEQEYHTQISFGVLCVRRKDLMVGRKRQRKRMSYITVKI
jgi:hypothetical protein